MGKMYSIEEQTLTDIINVPRGILNIDSEQKFPPSEFPNMINNAIGYISESVGNSAYQGGLEEGYNNGYSAAMNDVSDIIENSYQSGLEEGYNNGYGEGTENGIEIGKQISYDEFWDAYQNYGARTEYSRAFAGSGWVYGKTYAPKYPVRPTNAENMFYGCTLPYEAVKEVDFSNCTYMYSVFSYSGIERLGVIDVRKATQMGTAIYACSCLHTIDKVISAATTPYTNNSFSTLPNLENIEFEGVIGESIYFNWSPKLTKASIESIVSHLSTTSSGKSFTLSQTAVNKAFETSVGANNGSTSAEWGTLVGTRSNWTISLV